MSSLRTTTLGFLIYAVLCAAPQLAVAQTARHTPSYAQCQKLSNPRLDPQEKAQLTQLFKTNNMFCAMVTPPIVVQNIFNPGQTKSQLRITMGGSGAYKIDNKSLLDTLLPDRASIAPMQYVMLAGQIFAVLSDLFASNVDPNAIRHVSGKVSLLAGNVGNNARAALAQLDQLRAQTKLDTRDIEESFWLTKLSALEPAPINAVSNVNAASAPTGPAWMQKAFGAAKHLLGNVQIGAD
jgi:hypothetical protein